VLATTHAKKEVIGMRARFRAVNWRSLLYTGAAFATLLFAAGARWKPK
jgi:hypothetical protein